MEELKDWLEIIYLLCGPLIVLIAYLALGQIKVAKQQLEEQRKMLHVTSKRDTLKLTSEQVALFLDKIVKLANVLNEKLVAENITILDEFNVEFCSDSIKLIPPKGDFKFNLERFISEFAALSNSMESFSVFFIAGVTDEKLAFLSVGSSFCTNMKKLSPIMIPLSKNTGNYTSVLSLYSIWGSRLERESLEKQKEEIESKIKNKNNMSVRVVGLSN